MPAADEDAVLVHRAGVTTPRPTKTSRASASEKGVLPKGVLRNPKVDNRVRLVNGLDVLVAPVSPKHNLALIAGAQRGRVSAGQLLLAGYSRQMIRSAVANRSLHRLHRGVYAVGHLAEIELGRETAALLAAGPSAALVSITALEVLKVIPPDSSRPVHVAHQGRGWSRGRAGIVAHTYHLLPSQIRIREGLPVTSAERALLDAAPLLTPRQLERAYDEAIATRATSRTKVLELLSVTSGRAGQASLAALADPLRRSGRTQSPPEERALALIRAAGLPAPETQYPLHGFSADFFWPEAGVVFEVDGFGVHGLIRSNFVRDRRKDRVFRDHGLQVIRAAADELEDQPLQIVAHLTRTITERTLVQDAAGSKGISGRRLGRAGVEAATLHLGRAG